MLQFEVLIGELLAVDGLPTGALDSSVWYDIKDVDRDSYIATSEVTTLQHELGNDTVELRSRVAKALLSGAKSTEILGGLRNNIVVEVEVDTTGLF